jgi:hypothetical protein
MNILLLKNLCVGGWSDGHHYWNLVDSHTKQGAGPTPFLQRDKNSFKKFIITRKNACKVVSCLSNEKFHNNCTILRLLAVPVPSAPKNWKNPVTGFALAEHPNQDNDKNGMLFSYSFFCHLSRKVLNTN